MLVQCLKNLEKVFEYLGKWVTNNCELSCGCWALNPGSLEEQKKSLKTELYLQPIQWSSNSMFRPTSRCFVHLKVNNLESYPMISRKQLSPRSTSNYKTTDLSYQLFLVFLYTNRAPYTPTVSVNQLPMKRRTDIKHIFFLCKLLER